MKIKIALHYNYGYSWYTADGISVKGFIFDAANEVMKGAALQAYFSQVHSEEEFKEKLKAANGLFSVVIQKEDCVFAAVDITRTFPLFYSLKEGNLTISDAAEACAAQPLQLLEQAKEEFLFTGYVTGSRTLLAGVSQVEAGSGILFREQLSSFSYHAYIGEGKTEQSFSVLADRLATLFDEAGKRLVAALQGRTAVLPLSGGYDSRLIAVLLKKQNYPGVICYTYGTSSGPDVRISEKVARQLGFPWHFIPYTPAVTGDFLHSAAFREYFPFAANCTSMFFTQDYFAVKYLKENAMVPQDAVVVPGHTGDFLAGGHLVPGLTQQNVAERILQRHYVFRKGDTAAFGQYIKTIPGAQPYESFENWNMKERQSKFIINSNRIYEFWNFEHLVPLWDKALVDFFRKVSLEHRTGRKLFDYVLFRYFFEPYAVAYTKKNYPFLMRKVTGARNRLRRAIFSDPINFKLVARSFLKDRPLGMQWSSKEVNINRIQTAWYIAWLEEHIKAGR
jgi:asparagine synthase (glutamine-hydrolysing)